MLFQVSGASGTIAYPRVNGLGTPGLGNLTATGFATLQSISGDTICCQLSPSRP
jgi:hypothetical protein